MQTGRPPTPIFIDSLAFAEYPDLLLKAKVGIVFASIGAGVSGYVWLVKCSSDRQ